MSFCHVLSHEDRQRLRAIVKRVHLRHYPKDFVTDYEADKLIDAFAPNVLEQVLRIGVEKGAVEKKVIV